MSILILVERVMPSDYGKEPMAAPNNKPLLDALRFLAKFRKIKHSDFVFEYAIDTETTADDKELFSYKAFGYAVDDDRLKSLIDKHEYIIVLGSKLFKYLTGKNLASHKSGYFKYGEKKLFANYTPFYLKQNKKLCKSTFDLAYKYYNGEIAERPLPTHEIVYTLERLREVVKFAAITGIVAFDFETLGFSAHKKDEPATILSLTFQPGHAFIVPFEHQAFSWGDDFAEMISILQTLFGDTSITKVGHNIKFDWHYLRRYGITLKPRFVDTMLMHLLIDERIKHGLKVLQQLYFPYWNDYDKDVDFKGPIQQLAKYAAVDTDVTLMLFYIFENELLKPGNERLYRLLRNLYMPATQAFQDIEWQGVKLDRELIIKSIVKLKQLIKTTYASLNDFPEIKAYIYTLNEEAIAKKRDELETKITKRIDKAADKHLKKYGSLDCFSEEYADRFITKYREQLRDLAMKPQLVTEINFNSPKQLLGLLYEGFKFPVPVIDGTAVRTTARDALKTIDHAFITALFQYRTLTKMLSTYYEGLLERLLPNDFIHGSFLLHGTRTGRISSKNPNLQNIPGRIRLGDENTSWAIKQIKKFFIPRSSDRLLIQADFSQAELREIANQANEKVMIQAYKEGKDLHAITGARMAGLPFEEFLHLEDYKEQRTNAKGANFSIVYDVTAPGYQQYVYNSSNKRITLETAEKHRQAVFTAYPGLQPWHRRMKRIADKHKYVETKFGRRRHFSNIGNTTNKSLINSDYREAINSPIQGSIGEYTVFVITLLWHRLPKDVIIWSTVHDSEFFDLKFTDLHHLAMIDSTSSSAPIQEYFLVPDDLCQVDMKMDYEYSAESWGGMVEAEGGYKEIIDLFTPDV